MPAKVTKEKEKKGGGEKKEESLFRGCCWCFCHVDAENMKKEERVKSYEGKEKKKKPRAKGIHTQKEPINEKGGKTPLLKAKNRGIALIHSLLLHPSNKLPFLVVAALPLSTSSALLPITSPLPESRMLSSIRYLCTFPTLGGRLSGSS